MISDQNCVVEFMSTTKAPQCTTTHTHTHNHQNTHSGKSYLFIFTIRQNWCLVRSIGVGCWMLLNKHKNVYLSFAFYLNCISLHADMLCKIMYKMRGFFLKQIHNG